MVRWIGLICLTLAAGATWAQDQTSPAVPLNLLEETPQATATSTPAPTPKPAVTPLATLPGASRTPGVLPDDEDVSGDRTPTAKAPSLTAELDLIRMIKTRHFKPVDTSVLRAPTTVTRMKKKGPESELWQEGMMFQFEIKPPEDWGLIAVEKAVLLRVADQKGLPIGLPSEKMAAAPSSQMARPISWANPIDVTPERALIQLRCGMPARTDERLAEVIAGFQARIGIVRKVRIQDLRRHVGANLLGTGEQQNILIQVLEVDEDALRLKAWGQTDRLGEMLFFGPDGAELEPYGTDLNELESDGVTQRIYGFAFDSLPPQVSMVAAIYNDIQTQTFTLELKDVPLP